MSIGQVTSIVGIVTATDASGNERVLALGDDIFEGEIIFASQGANVKILMLTGDEVVVADGQQWSPTSDTFNTAESIGVDNQVVSPSDLASLDSIQQALLLGQDVTQTADSTAAGAGAGTGAAGLADGEGGAGFVNVARTEISVRDASDFSTIGTEVGFAEPDIEDQLFPAPVVISVTSSSTPASSFVDSG